MARFDSMRHLVESRRARRTKTKMETPKHKCGACAKRHNEDIQAEEFNLAVLIALVPLLVFTLFGQLGLF
jgi:hypothetical protein